jgi:membrane-associated phospholipid phosphatase
MTAITHSAPGAGLPTPSRADRYQADPRRPELLAALGDMLTRAWLPGFTWLVLMTLGGFLLMGPLRSFADAEDAVNRAVQEGRSPFQDDIWHYVSLIGNTEVVIAATVLAAVLVWWRTRQWWVAVIAPLALSMQALFMVIANAVVARPRPDVARLDDPAPPTSSYPSGHVGAPTTLYITLLVLAQRITHPTLRWAATIGCAAIPMLVMYARVYRGMHHVTDVVVGLINGIVCVYLAWHFLRREPRP